jgi:hypothetical protein
MASDGGGILDTASVATMVPGDPRPGGPDIMITPSDGIRFDAAPHAALGDAIVEKIKGMDL